MTQSDKEIRVSGSLENHYSPIAQVLLRENAVAGQGLIAGLQAANRARTGAKQVGARVLLADQEAISPAPVPTQISVPEVAMPTFSEEVPKAIFSPEADPNQQFLNRQMNLRERAKSNPYIASTLLGGLGSAGLL